MDKRELLKNLLRGSITKDELNPTPWLYVLRTMVDGVPVAEDIFAVPTPQPPRECHRITQEKAHRIAQLLKGSKWFGCGFLAVCDFDGEPEPWAAFGGTIPVAYTGLQHDPISHGLGVGLISEQLYLIS